ncbi:MAG: DUF433 domain-containing protein [Pyrinomonadaceae bacterium]
MQQTLTLPISVNPKIKNGMPMFEGTRVPVYALFDCLLEGQNLEEFLNDFDSVKREEVEEILRFVKKSFIQTD